MSAPLAYWHDRAAGSSVQASSANSQRRADTCSRMVDVKVTSSEQHRRPLAVAACIGAIGLLYVAYLGQSRSLGTDAGGGSQGLQARGTLPPAAPLPRS